MSAESYLARSSLKDQLRENTFKTKTAEPSQKLTSTDIFEVTRQMTKEKGLPPGGEATTRNEGKRLRDAFSDSLGPPPGSQI